MDVPDPSNDWDGTLPPNLCPPPRTVLSREKIIENARDARTYARKRGCPPTSPEPARSRLQQEQRTREAAEALLRQEREKREAAEALLRQERKKREAAEAMLRQEWKKREAAEARDPADAYYTDLHLTVLKREIAQMEELQKVWLRKASYSALQERNLRRAEQKQAKASRAHAEANEQVRRERALASEYTRQTCEAWHFATVAETREAKAKEDKERERNARLRAEKKIGEAATKLYHQTDSATARIILTSQRMKPGSSGLAGGGIYFATTKELTGHKAHKHGVILEATVSLGKILTLESNGDPSMTGSKLNDLGFGSACIARPVHSGHEYVVYDPRQVLEIQRAS